MIFPAKPYWKNPILLYYEGDERYSSSTTTTTIMIHHDIIVIYLVSYRQEGCGKQSDCRHRALGDDGILLTPFAGVPRADSCNKEVNAEAIS